jgi:hypothetical protein
MNWINIKDKLPKNKEIVLVWSKYDNTWFESYFLNGNFSFADDRINRYFTIKEISHWMIPIKPE